MQSVTILDQLRSLSSAEDFFALLDVPCDPAVLNIARLHILRRMGEYLRKNAPDESDQESARALCRAQLRQACNDFVESTPLEQRVFKVLKEAVAPPSAPLVQISSVTQEGQG